MKKILIAATIIASLSAGAVQAGLVVTADTDANNLANAIVGSGITFSGAAYSGDTGSNGSGTFTGGISAGLGFDSGILLTTGNISCAPGPNSSGSCTGAGVTSQLAFNFTTSTGNVFFNYVFGSEEYLEYVGSSFNDIFTLLVDGVNVALIPGGGGVVSINNVHAAVTNGYGTFGASNGAYFINNAGGTGLQYDGLTTVLTATATGLAAGNHTMVFNIHDNGDSSLDSGVFIQAGTFSTDPTPTSLPGTLALLGLGLVGLAGLRRLPV